MTGNDYADWLILWIMCAGVALWSQRKSAAGAGLTISYVLQLWMLHWLAAAIYVLPWYDSPTTEMFVGLQQSVIGVAGFAAGCTFIAPFVLRMNLQPAYAPVVIDSRVVHICLAVGVVTYFVVEPIVHDIPTVGALASGTSNLLIVALVMECWNGLQATSRDSRSFWRWIPFVFMLPVMTIVTKGFLGYGFASMLTVLAFVACFYRPRWKLVAASLLVGYLALSLYVTYMRDRREIRAVVWGGQTYASRISAMTRTFSEFELLDITSIDHLTRIDERLNQNYFIGRAVEYIDQGSASLARGRTIWSALLAPIPRALWPSKPSTAGSGDLMTEYTGITFARGTSVGIGHLLEWYINFGSAGVFFGMLIMGVLLAWLDRIAATRLHEGDPGGFVIYWLPGLGLLQVGGSLVDGMGTTASGLLIAYGLRKWLQTRTNVSDERNYEALFNGEPKPTPR